ncbi:hypothetical protein BDB01DRAFT_885339 [Pilobolus umbonatus]|nr:hypothetical protein BDB01DRAFT_885339 [Pilobolus umbonatus]
MSRIPFVPVQDHSVVDLSSFFRAMPFTRTAKGSFFPSTKKYRDTCAPLYAVIPILPRRFLPTTPFPWDRFWNLPLTHTARNLWYRLLHRKTPSHVPAKQPNTKLVSIRSMHYLPIPIRGS